MSRQYKTDLFKKRQYEWLAEFVRNLTLPVTNDGVVLQEAIAEELSKALRGSNPRFDRERFLRACQPKDQE